MDEPIAIVQGDDAVRVVLRFGHGQAASVHLKLRDGSSAGVPFTLAGAEIAGAKIVVQPAKDERSKCSQVGHLILFSWTAKTKRPGAVCAECGDAVQLDPTDVPFNSDPDAWFARRLALRIGEIPPDAALNAVAAMRARLMARKGELRSALADLDLALERLKQPVKEMIQDLAGSATKPDPLAPEEP